MISPLQGRQSKPLYCYFATKFQTVIKVIRVLVNQLVIYSTKLGGVGFTITEYYHI